MAARANPENLAIGLPYFLFLEKIEFTSLISVFFVDLSIQIGDFRVRVESVNHTFYG